MLNPIPESIDLLTLSQRLRRSDASMPKLEGYLEGKTMLRDRLLSLLACSELEAERLIDTLEARGFLRFHGSDGYGSTRGYWEVPEQQRG
jgi:hypothetical protein